MNRKVLSVVALGGLSACMSGTSPDAVEQNPDKPAAVISDGSRSLAGANPDFFFLPPLVKNPSNTPNWSAGQFNASLKPTLEICELNASTEGSITVGTPCKDGTTKSVPFGPDGVALHGAGVESDDPTALDGHYHFNWKIPTSNAVFYRVIISAGTTPLGFADVETVQNGSQLKNINTGEFVAAKDGSNAPIKFRIENHALCVPAGNYTVPCASATINLATGGSVTTTVGNLPTGLVVPPQTSTTTATFTVQPCATSDIAVDLPLFGSCVSVSSQPTNVSFPNGALVFVCDYPPEVSSLPSGQDDLVLLHAQHTTFTEALVEAPASCPVSSSMNQGSLKGLLASAWHGDWKQARRELVNMIQPEPLMAMFLHAGGGGVTGIQSEFQFALSAKMEIDQGNGGSATPGSTVTASVKVTDLFGAPVENAKVHFAIGSGGGSVSAAQVLSDANGISAVQWTLGTGAGPFTLIASGFGIASPTTNGPRTASGDFQAHTLGYGCASPPCSFPAQTFDPFAPKAVDIEGQPDALVAAPQNGTGGATLQTGSVTFTKTATVVGEPMNVFGFGSAGYRFMNDIKFDGINPRTTPDATPHTGGSADPPANWFTTGFDDSAAPWLQNQHAPFGSTFAGCAINSTVFSDWGIFTDGLFRKSFTTPYTGTLTIAVQIDNDLQIWLDGTNITANAPNTTQGGYAGVGIGWWFHGNCANDGNPVFVVHGVPAGNHVLAIRGHDFGGATFMDAKVDLAPDPTP